MAQATFEMALQSKHHTTPFPTIIATMGAWLTQPVCGVPVHQMTGVANATRIVRDCAKTNATWACGIAVVAALVIVVLSLTWRRQGGDAGDETEPVVPLWAAAVPLGLGVLYGAVAVPLATARLRVADARLATSGMNKADWLRHHTADKRTAGQVMGALGASAIVAASVLGTH